MNAMDLLADVMSLSLWAVFLIMLLVVFVAIDFR